MYILAFLAVMFALIIFAIIGKIEKPRETKVEKVKHAILNTFLAIGFGCFMAVALFVGLIILILTI